MKISELTIGQGNVEVEGTITEIGETKTFNKFGRDLSVANAMLKNESGSIKLTLWNDDVSRFKDGDKLKVVNGYVNEFQGEKQLTSGKYGQLEKVEGGSSETATEAEETTDEPADKAEESKSTADTEESEESSTDTGETEDSEPTELETIEEANEEPKEPEETTF